MHMLSHFLVFYFFFGFEESTCFKYDVKLNAIRLPSNVNNCCAKLLQCIDDDGKINVDVLQ